MSVAYGRGPRVRACNDYLPPELWRAALAEWPPPGDYWHRYDSPLERKWACDDWAAFGPALRHALALLLSEDCFACGGGVADTMLWGGGLHMMGRGDHLGLHLDADRHARTGMERVGNALLYLGAWEPQWGGELWLGGRRVPCVANTLVTFPAGEDAVHGVPVPLDCPQGVFRKSLAVFWWRAAPATPGKRPRALFLPTPGEPDTPELQRLRRERAGL